MLSDRSLDARNPLTRSLERWKRGLTAAIMVCLWGGAALLAGALPFYLLADLAGAEWIKTLAVPGVIVVGPWLIGARQFLRSIGGLASISDDHAA